MASTTSWYGPHGEASSSTGSAQVYHHSNVYSHSRVMHAVPTAPSTGAMNSSSSSAINGHAGSGTVTMNNGDPSQPTHQQRTKRQVGRPRIETTKVPAEITDKLERTRALGRERQRRKRERDRQSAMQSPSTFMSATDQKSAAVHFNRSREDPPFTAVHHQPPESPSGKHRQRSIYHPSPSSNSLSFEPLNISTASYLETSPIHFKGPSPVDRAYVTGAYHVSPARTTMSTPSMDGPSQPSRTPNDVPTNVDPMASSPQSTPMSPSQSGIFFANNMLIALRSAADLCDHTLRSLGMNEADLDAMREELALTYDRYRAAQRQMTRSYDEGSVVQPAGGAYPGAPMNGVDPAANQNQVFARSAPASLVRGESWPEQGMSSSHPRAGGASHDRYGDLHRMGQPRSRTDTMDSRGGSSSGFNSSTTFDRPPSSMGGDQLLHSTSMSSQHTGGDGSSRSGGLNMHFGPRAQSPSQGSMPPLPHADATGTMMNPQLDQQHVPPYNPWQRDHSYDSTPAIIATMDDPPSMVTHIGGPPSSTLRPIRAEPYGDRGGGMGSTYVGGTLQTAPMPMPYHNPMQSHHHDHHHSHQSAGSHDEVYDTTQLPVQQQAYAHSGYA